MIKQFAEDLPPFVQNVIISQESVEQATISIQTVLKEMHHVSKSFCCVLYVHSKLIPVFLEQPVYNNSII